MTDPYDKVIEALAPYGINADREVNYLAVSTQVGLILPYGGNSFWVSCIGGEWYICTWVPVCYRLPSKCDVVGLCVESMGDGPKAMYRLPDDIVRKHGLQELNESEVDELFGWYGETTEQD